MTRANALLYFGASLVPRLATFALLLLLTRLLPIGDYGLFTLVVTTGEILDMSAGGWVRIFILKNEGARSPSAGRLGRALVLAVGSCAVAMLAALLLPLVQPNLSGYFVIAVVAYVLSFATLRFGLTLLQTQQQHLAYAAVEIARGLLLVAGTIVAIVAVGPTFFVASLGASLATLALALFACAAAFRNLPRPALPSAGYRAALIFGVPLVAITLVGHITGLLDRYILNYALGPASVGLYAAAYALARQPVDLFGTALNPYMFPMLVRSHAAEGRQRAGEIQAGTLMALLLLCGAVAAGVSLLAEPFAALVLPAEYRAVAAQVMPWIATAALLGVLHSFCFENAFYVAGKNWRQFAAIVPAALLSVVFGVSFIPGGGPVAAAIIAAGAAALLLLVSAWLSLRILPFTVPWRAVAGFVAALALASGAAYAVESLLRFQPPLAILAGATLAFVAVYAAALTAFGFSLLRLIDRPWEVWQGRSGLRYRARDASTLPNRSR